MLLNRNITIYTPIEALDILRKNSNNQFFFWYKLTTKLIDQNICNNIWVLLIFNTHSILYFLLFSISLSIILSTYYIYHTTFYFFPSQDLFGCMSTYEWNIFKLILNHLHHALIFFSPSVKREGPFLKQTLL
jgi:hypothetical protein